MSDREEDWNELGDCFYHTGYPEEHLDYIWDKYCTLPSSPIANKGVLLQGLKFIHRYPRWRQVDYDLKTSSWSLSHHVIPGLHWLGSTLNEIHWHERLNPYNHSVHFPCYVTGLVDTTPVYVQTPTDSQMRKLLYNPKYGRTVYKLQIGIDFLGRIVLFSGLHFGTSYDGHIWDWTSAKHRMENWEYFLGDGHYTACEDIVSPPQQPPHGHMSDTDYLMCVLIQHYRARIEHINSVIKSHEVFKTPFRGCFELLNSICHVTAHISNIGLHEDLRYPLVGPWAHDPDLQ